LGFFLLASYVLLIVGNRYFRRLKTGYL